MRQSHLYNFVDQDQILVDTDLFITHGGLNSVSEAICHLTPMIVVPQAGDQFFISKQLVSFSAANEVINNDTFIEDTINAIDKITEGWDNYQNNLIDIKRSFINQDSIDMTLTKLVGMFEDNKNLYEQEL